MMEKYGSERAYNRNVINAFKNADEPEIIIVVDKLLTGFDAPRNTVLYLTRELKDHTLLQAIARVNRLYEGKDFGYIIDYEGVLQSLDKALDLYGKLADFDAGDLDSTITDIASRDREPPRQAHRPLVPVRCGQEPEGRGAVRAAPGRASRPRPVLRSALQLRSDARRSPCRRPSSSRRRPRRRSIVTRTT